MPQLGIPQGESWIKRLYFQCAVKIKQPHTYDRALEKTLTGHDMRSFFPKNQTDIGSTAGPPRRRAVESLF